MLVLVVAEDHEEFRSLVLLDTQNIGEGSATFLKSEEKVVRWQSSADPEHKVRYVWAKDYGEMRSSLDQDNFRILSKSSMAVDAKRISLSNEAKFACAALAFVVCAFLVFLKG